MSPQPVTIPRYADTVVIGGGTSGAVVAGRLAARSDRAVLLLEAGPDYGPYEAGAWPRALLDARALIIEGHSWNYRSAARHGRPDLLLDRARVIGGCSSHNGCAAIWGSRADYDGWAALGNVGWGTGDLLPLFREGSRILQVRVPAWGEITPWHRACLEAAPGAGIPRVTDLNDLDQDVGMAPSPANILRGVRWNAAFAYLDPVRQRPNLTIRGEVLVDRLTIGQGRVVGVEAIGPEGPLRVEARQVVLSAGAYGSPAVLLRSGIGAPEELRALGIDPLHALPGVGRNLHDHPAFPLLYNGTPELIAAMRAFEDAGGWLPEEQTIGKARSSHCREAFDLHLYPVGGPYNMPPGAWLFAINVAAMTPRSRGSVRLAGRSPELEPIIDHGYLTDAEGHDLAVLLDGVALARDLARQAPLARLIGAETAPGTNVDGAELRAHLPANSNHYYHPVGTCAMGPAADPMAVVDAQGRVHGLEGLFVADASIMPVIPRANTNMPCIVIGEKIAAGLPA